MPKKKKSQIKPVHNAPKGNSKHTGDKKIIVCHCWPGVYEAAYRALNDYSNKDLNGEKLSMSEFINVLICSAHAFIFGYMPEGIDDEIENLKGEN